VSANKRSYPTPRRVADCGVVDGIFIVAAQFMARIIWRS